MSAPPRTYARPETPTVIPLGWRILIERLPRRWTSAGRKIKCDIHERVILFPSLVT
jgi:hypothetical protein